MYIKCIGGNVHEVKNKRIPSFHAKSKETEPERKLKYLRPAYNSTSVLGPYYTSSFSQVLPYQSILNGKDSKLNQFLPVTSCSRVKKEEGRMAKVRSKSVATNGRKRP